MEEMLPPVLMLPTELIEDHGENKDGPEEYEDRDEFFKLSTLDNPAVDRMELLLDNDGEFCSPP